MAGDATYRLTFIFGFSANTFETRLHDDTTHYLDYFIPVLKDWLATRTQHGILQAYDKFTRWQMMLRTDQPSFSGFPPTSLRPGYTTTRPTLYSSHYLLQLSPTTSWRSSALLSIRPCRVDYAYIVPLAPFISYLRSRPLSRRLVEMFVNHAPVYT